MKTVSLALLASLLCGVAHAGVVEDADQGKIMICDTLQQAERITQVYAGKVDEAMKLVNEEAHNSTACIIQGVAYYKGDKTTRMRGPGGGFDITRILVVGVMASTSVMPTHPSIYYGVFLQPESGV